MTEWSPQQEKALREVERWYKNESKKKQVFYIGGFAGTGKTTLAVHFAQNIMGTVKFAAFTGKAAHVMSTKGCAGASTIHRLIYRPKSASKDRLRQLEVKLKELESNSDTDKEVIIRTKEEIKKEQENAGRMSFSLNLESELQFSKLLIIDEVSMVNEQMGKDLESFKIPIIVLGDPEQLPPVFGTGYYTERKPDVMLSEIHRQALDNPIIRISKMVREGNPLPLGDYGSSRVINSRLDAQDVLAHDIILTGLRDTKKACDRKYREITGRAQSPLPVIGDRLMCIKNNHNLGLLNGQIWETMSTVVSMGGGVVSLHIRNTETNEEIAVCASEKLLLGQKLERWEHEEDIEEFEYSYAITVHKSQGSQWDKVLLIDQKDRFNWSERDKRRWLYTGITRAAQSVTVMRL